MPGFVWAETPLVLTIRPELIAGEQQGYPVPDNMENPFVWSEKKTGGEPDTGREEQLKAEAAFSELKIGGILWNKKNPQAIVNGHLLTVNDELDGATVIRIDKKSLTLRKGELVHILKFNEPDLNFDQ